MLISGVVSHHIAKPKNRFLSLTRLELFMAAMAVLLGWSSAYSKDPDLIYTFDFTDYTAGAVLTWLSAKGFVPEQDMLLVHDRSTFPLPRHIGQFLNEQSSTRWGKMEIGGTPREKSSSSSRSA